MSYDPEEIIMRSLAASAAGEPYDSDAVEEACMVLAAATLIRLGDVSYETACRAVEQAVSNGGTIHISFSVKDGLEVTLKRGEDELPASIV